MDKILHVFLGKFAPFHKGHQEIVEKLITNFGEENVLILIGSSNSLNSKTPYTYKDRERMIRTLYPNILVHPLPDSSKNITKFTNSGNQIWFSNIKNQEKKLGARFIFYGGSPEDLAIVSQIFPVQIIVDRKITNISATKVRKLIKERKYEELENYLDQKIIPQAIKHIKTLTR